MRLDEFRNFGFKEITEIIRQHPDYADSIERDLSVREYEDGIMIRSFSKDIHLICKCDETIGCSFEMIEGLKTSKIEGSGISISIQNLISYLDGLKNHISLLEDGLDNADLYTNKIDDFYTKFSAIKHSLKSIRWQDLRIEKDTKHNRNGIYCVKFTDEIQSKIDKLTDEIKKDRKGDKIVFTGTVGEAIELNPYIYISGEFNKFDWVYDYALKDYFVGIGLGEKIYRATSSEFGYISTNLKEASKSALRVWSKLVISDDYFVVLVDDVKCIIFDKNMDDIENTLKIKVFKDKKKDFKISKDLFDYLVNVDENYREFESKVIYDLSI